MSALPVAQIARRLLCLTALALILLTPSQLLAAAGAWTDQEVFVARFTSDGAVAVSLSK